MKKINAKISKKLSLNKEVVSRLTDNQMDLLKGGADSDRLCSNTPCVTNGCPTQTYQSKCCHVG